MHKATLFDLSDSPHNTPCSSTCQCTTSATGGVHAVLLLHRAQCTELLLLYMYTSYSYTNTYSSCQTQHQRYPTAWLKQAAGQSQKLHWRPVRAVTPAALVYVPAVALQMLRYHGCPGPAAVAALAVVQLPV